MQFIANDIVSLADSRHRRGFQKRILSTMESKLNESELLQDPLAIWKIWSAKETAYKFFRQKVCDIPFLPKSYKVDLKEEIVSFREYQCNISHITTNGFVFCFSEQLDSSIYKSIHVVKPFLHPIQESIEVRKLCTDILFDHGIIERKADIYYQKSTSGQPQALASNQKLQVYISFTHHLFHVGCSLIIKKTRET